MAGLSNSGTFNLGITPQMQEREDLFNSQTVKEFNTYSTWDEMQLFNDVTDINLVRGNDGTVKEEPSTKAGYGVKSIFNRWTLVPVLNNETRMKMNAPLVDTSDTRRAMKERSNPSIKNLVEQSRLGTLGRETYDYSDFMYCKHLGKMPNNYLITLRRFPVACNDYIGQLASPDEEREIATSLGCLVTWLGTPGNDIENILSYSYKMPFKEVTAEMQYPQYNDNSSPIGNMFAAFDSKYQQQVHAGYAGNAITSFAEKLGLPWDNAPYSDHLTFRDSNKIYGPVDVVKKTHMRDDSGLDFNHSFNLRFEYELRSYSNINTRQAMLDLLANILTVTYVNGSFWRGGYRGMGVHESDIFSNLKIMKTKGGVTDFMDAFANDITTVGSAVSAKFKGKDILETLKNVANSFGGMLLGGMLNKLGRPQKQTVNSLLSPAPVGLWHVTVGNPFHPIMSIGNLILDETKVTHQGPLGLDDFPTKLIVECTLKRAKGRDSNDIERLYNHGAVRIYSGLEAHTVDLIKSAPNYSKISTDQHSSVSTEYTDSPSRVQNETGKNLSDEFTTGMDAMTRYWQTHNLDTVILAGKEWLRGGGSKTKASSTGKK